ncbi:hypothetical protein [Sanguibacter sp. 25GB23B1]|uniref:hypothetical protein n=1 Tax=unclassified Sanguibacter TaxID=2645534 RepID=UPI0032B01322
MSTVLGGPELDLGQLRALRHALKTAVSEVSVDGLDEIDVQLRIGGSITPAEGDGGVHSVRFSAARRRITANAIVPKVVI